MTTPDAPSGTAGQEAENTCPACAGTGSVDGADCRSCAGTGTVVEPVGDA